MTYDWTRGGQDKALEINDKSVLVSASAGTGKTTVMVEKIFRYLVEGSITRLMVITFTKASAADMRAKLVERLCAEIRTGGALAEHYKEQLKLLPLAYIGTIDSVCAEFYHRYFEDIGGNPSLSVMDESESQAMMVEATEQVLREYLTAEDADFRDLQSFFSAGRTLKPLVEAVVYVCKYMRAQADPDAFTELARARASENPETSIAVDYLLRHHRKRFAAFEREYQTLRERAGWLEFKGDDAAMDEIEDNLCSVRHAATAKDFFRVMGDLRFGVTLLRSARGLTDEQKDLHTAIKSLKKRLESAVNELYESVPDYAVALGNEERSKRNIKKLLDVVTDMRKVYSQMKLDDNKMDFADVEHFALKIVSNEERATEIKESLDYIFLDEYQDTNRLQESIFAKIEKGNLFMVGDLKQSIYRFRFAEPQIFSERRDAFRSGGEGANVPLNMNYRSTQGVLSFVDEVFSELMTEDFGGVDYRKDACFGEAGQSYPKVSELPSATIALVPNESAQKPELPPVYSVKNADTKDENLSREGAYVATKILSLVGKEKIYDPSLKVARKIRFSDIVVLLRKKSAPKLLAAFDFYGVPYVSEGSTAEPDMRDIDALTSVLKVVDNPEDDYALAAAMLSFFGGFTEEELYSIRKNSKEDFFYGAVAAYSGELKPKIDRFFAMIEECRKIAPLTDVPSLMAGLATDTGFEAHLLSENAFTRIETYNSYLNFLRDKPFARSVRAYLDYRDSGVSAAIPLTPSAGDSIRLCTIHGSKGLEYPVVFLAQCGGRTGNFISGANILLDPEFGLAVNAYDEESKTSRKTLTRLAFECKETHKTREEELRLLYVAMTRAINHLFISGTVARSFTPETPAEKSTFIDWIRLAIDKNPALEQYVDRDCAVGSPEDVSIVKERYAVTGGLEPHNISTEYPCADSCEIGNKYSVSVLNSEQKETRDENRFTQSLGSQSIESGISYHKIMELIDFADFSREGIAAQIAKMEDAGYIERGAADIDLVRRAVMNPIFDAARKGKTLREQEFIYYVPACEVLPGCASTDKTLVQGVMDLVILGEDENVLVDYKVTNASAGVVRERYAKQIDLYSRAFESLSGKKLGRKAVFILNRNEVVEF